MIYQPALLRKLSILHSLELFHTHRYDLAIDAFIALDISPAKVVALYPLAISGKLYTEFDGHEELFGGRSLEEVELARKHKGDQERIAEGEAQPLTKKVEDDTMSIRSVIPSRLRGSKSFTSDLNTVSTGDLEKQAALDKKRETGSIDSLIRYLTDRRQKYTQSLSALLPSSRPSPLDQRSSLTGSELLELIPDEPLGKLEPQVLARVAEVVDTALFRAYLVSKGGVMVGPLCRIENWCEVEQVETLLSEKKKFSELLDLYNGKNMHQKAVTLLRK